jgi:hypothetical protein
MPQFIGTTFRITYYNDQRARVSYILATTQQEADRIATVYRQSSEAVLSVKPCNL